MGRLVKPATQAADQYRPFGGNSVGILVGAAGRITPFIAALLHNLSTVAVVLNSSRLTGYRDPGAAAVTPTAPLSAAPAPRLPEPGGPRLGSVTDGEAAA